jgi:hypothetical protein
MRKRRMRSYSVTTEFVFVMKKNSGNAYGDSGGQNKDTFRQKMLSDATNRSLMCE